MEPGAFLKAKLPRFGYTGVAKAPGIECVEDLLRESTTYSCLLLMQGKGVPVCLGNIKVDSLLYYAGAVRIVHSGQPGITWIDFERAEVFSL
jgi:hypothetical protein